MVAPYHTPWLLIEEIGMLDHLTGGRLEIGTAAGIPNKMAKVGLEPDEARACNDEARHPRCRPEESGDLAPWQVLELRQSPPDSATAAAAGATGLGHGGQCVIGAQSGATRRQAMHRLSSVEQDRRDLRCVSRRGSQDRSERRA
jgi:hypothetical protein